VLYFRTDVFFGEKSPLKAYIKHATCAINTLVIGGVLCATRDLIVRTLGQRWSSGRFHGPDNGNKRIPQCQLR
jgi:hypothetical protein